MTDSPNDGITLRVSLRPDGGIRVLCDEIPGLILSGLDHRKVMADVPVVWARISKWRMNDDNL